MYYNLQVKNALVWFLTIYKNKTQILERPVNFCKFLLSSPYLVIATVGLLTFNYRIDQQPKFTEFKLNMA